MCEIVINNNTNNNNNNTNNNSNSNNNTDINTPSVSASALNPLGSNIPPYCGLYALGGFATIFMIVKFKHSPTRLILCLLVVVGLCDSFILGDIIYM